MRVIDISEPSNPCEIASCQTNGYARDIAIQDNYAFVVDNTLLTFDITDPANPLLIGGYSSIEIYNGIVVSGNYAYIAYMLDVSGGMFGLWVFDISYPREPMPCGSVITPGGEYAYSLRVEGDYVYLANGIGGLQVYNIADPYNPQMFGLYRIRWT